MKAWAMTTAQLCVTLIIYMLGALFYGAALTPALLLIQKVWGLSAHWPAGLRVFGLAVTLALSFFLFGLCLVLLVGLFRALFRFRLKEGTYPLLSGEGVKWLFMSSLYLMIHYTFIDFILLTPFANLLFRLLGAKLGKNVQINSKYIFDATLLEIGDNTVIGGGAIINGHMVEGGRLKLKKVKIGRKVTIGSHATVMPGCKIGDRALIGASAVLLKNSIVPEKDVWYGIPAASIRKRNGIQ
jgi:serine acetyltransferase